MKFSEAIIALEQGKKIRESHWPAHNWISRDASSSGNLSMLHPLMKDDWEVFEEPKKTLSFSEVLKGLKEGKMFKRKSWGPRYLISRDRDYSGEDVLHVCAPASNLSAQDIESNDWEEYVPNN